MFKMLTGRKFEVPFLLGFHLSSGTTRVAFAKSGNMLCLILELIDLVKIGVKRSLATFINFGEMVSIINFLFRFHLQNENEIFSFT